ncbi:MAG: TerB N-terminal domain-containing protein [Atopobiaceae bacterium]|nr:TerB N-terminal domain-containing protein [Atopobiaceae bacterium]
MSRAQEIVDEILSGERYARSHVFSDRVYRDEPILRAGIRPRTPSQGPSMASAIPRTERLHMPAAYRKMRALGHNRGRGGWAAAQTASSAKLFYEQGKLMEDFEDDFSQPCEFARYFPTYDEMSDRELRCYFSWRAKLRAGETPEAPTSFLFVHAYELLCGIGVTPGEQGYAALEQFRAQYAGASSAFDTHLKRWSHDYVVFHGLDASLLEPMGGSFSLSSVALLVNAQEILLEADGSLTWPDDGPVARELPSPEDMLDALCSLSRYRAERSKFFKEHREDVALVCARVFARMVGHCHKRRKTDYLEGLFGVPARVSYTMFPSAVFWSPERHEDACFEASSAETYTCEHGFWWRELPCRRTETNRELGALLHAIDCRMRKATGDAHPLKERSLPKYQAKFVDEEIAALLAQRKAEEAARITIDWSALSGIRSASARTREALLTEDEREDDSLTAERFEPVSRNVAHEQPAAPVQPTVPLEPTVPPESSALGLDASQLTLLRALLDGQPLPANGGAMFLSLAVDAINEAFLDVVGDTVIDFDGETPVLVEDYEQDVRDALVDGV